MCVFACALALRVSVVSGARVRCFPWPGVLSFSSEFGTRGLTCEVGRMGGARPHASELRFLAAESRPVVLGYVFQCGCPRPCVVRLCPGLASVCHICRAHLLFTEALCDEFLSENGTWIPSVFCGPVC